MKAQIITKEDGTLDFIDAPELNNIIQLKNISQKYDNNTDKYVIKNLNLLIEDKPEQGQFVVLLGKSGCGKSTILRYISGLQKPTSGEVLIEGKEASGYIPMVFQQYSSFPWLTVRQNIALALELKGNKNKKENDEIVMDIIKHVGLEGHEDKFAQYPLLSGGQLQRVAIARSLIANPKIILMDEPFGALDVNTRFQMQLMLANVWGKLKSTVVFVTHDVAEAAFLGDDIYIMESNPGRLVKYFHVSLPFNRGWDIRRDPRFMETVHEIEDCLFDKK